MRTAPPKGLSNAISLAAQQQVAQKEIDYLVCAQSALNALKHWLEEQGRLPPESVVPSDPPWKELVFYRAILRDDSQDSKDWMPFEQSQIVLPSPPEAAGVPRDPDTDAGKAMQETYTVRYLGHFSLRLNRELQPFHNRARQVWDGWSRALLVKDIQVRLGALEEAAGK